MTSASSIVGGVFLIVFAGICNGSWNASFSPELNLAVAKRKKFTDEVTSAVSSSENIVDSESDPDIVTEVAATETEPLNDILYHHAFALFQIYAAAINIPVCIYWAGGASRVSAILSETSASSIVLVVVFSLIWGVGTLLFGMACQIAGVGLGTNLTIGVVAVIGTFLPLLTEQTLITPAGGIIVLGLFVCCIGLWISTKALKKRDADEDAYVKSKMASSDTPSNLLRDDESSFHADNTSVVDHHSSNPSKESWSIRLKTSQYIGLKRVSAFFRKTSSIRKKDNIENPPWKKIGICIIAGICCVQLQFAFIFGKRISDLSLGTIENIEDDAVLNRIPGSTHETGGAAIIWMLAISLGAPASIIHALLSSPVPISSAIRAPWWRHLRIIATTSLPWITHIHIYGVCASTLFPKRIAASIGWPMLMMVTTAQGTVLSLLLGEWKVASPDTLRTLKLSLLASFIGVGILMASVAAPNE